MKIKVKIKSEVRTLGVQAGQGNFADFAMSAEPAALRSWTKISISLG